MHNYLVKILIFWVRRAIGEANRLYEKRSRGAMKPHITGGQTVQSSVVFASV